MFLRDILDSHKSPPQSLEVKCICPWCRRHVVMERISGMPDKAAQSSSDISGNPIFTFICLRRCPACSGVCLAFMRGLEDKAKSLYEMWPKSKSEQVKEVPGMPDDVAKAIDQAIVNHAQGMLEPAAMMIRKAIELICEDVGATGGRLIDRIKSLKKLLILPDEIVDAMDEIRVFGNEGAHVFSRHYEVSEKEVAIAIELVIEINRAIYSHRHLLTKLKEYKLNHRN
jgi:hypothetical protein